MKQRASTLWKFTRNNHASARCFKLTKPRKKSKNKLTKMEEDEQNMTSFIIVYCMIWMLIIYGFITTL